MMEIVIQASEILQYSLEFDKRDDWHPTSLNTFITELNGRPQIFFHSCKLKS